MSDALTGLHDAIEKAAPRANMVQNRRRLAALKIRIAGLRGKGLGAKVKKAGEADAIDLLNAEIEKARTFRGVKMSAAQRRLVAGAGSNYKRVWRENGRSNFMQGGRRGKRVSVDGRQAKTTPSRTQRDIGARLRVRKSEELPMSDAVDNLYEAIEKAKSGGLIRGGSSAARSRIMLPGGKRSALKRYLGDRRHGGKVAAGSGGKRYAGYYESRRGKYK